MNFEEIAEEVIDECSRTYNYDMQNIVQFHQTVTDIANYAFEEWETALFVAFEEVVYRKLREMGHDPVD